MNDKVQKEWSNNRSNGVIKISYNKGSNDNDVSAQGVIIGTMVWSSLRGWVCKINASLDPIESQQLSEMLIYLNETAKNGLLNSL